MRTTVPPSPLVVPALTHRPLPDDRRVAWKWYIWVILPLIALPGLWSFVAQGLPDSHDGKIHLLRLVLLDDLIRQGIFFPRWMPQLLLGSGYPVFHYYAPLTYYLAEVWRLVGFNFDVALMMTWAALVIAGGYGMVLLARDVFNSEQPWPALVAATAYMYAPYLLTNVFVRGALAEVGAQALLPWVLWSVRRLMLAPEPRAHLLPVIVTIAALVVTHNITLVLLPGLLAAYIVVLWMRGDRRWARLGWLAVAITVVLGITAFFWLPLIGERGFLSTQAYNSARDSFMPQNVWRLGSFLNMAFQHDYQLPAPFRLGLVQIVLAATGSVLARRRDGEWLFFIAAALLTGLSVGAWALPIWTSSSVLLTVQFPWRLLTLLSLLLALLTGGIVCRLRPGWRQNAISSGVLAVIVLANTPKLTWMESMVQLPADATAAQVAQFEMTTRHVGVSITNEFIPRWTQALRYVPADEKAVPGLVIEPESGNPLALDARINSPAGGSLRFATLYFPSWEVRLDNDTILPTYPSTNLGVLTVDLPPGDHEITLRWAGTPLERIATWLTLLALGASAAIAWAFHRRWAAVLGLTGLICAVALLAWPATRQPVHVAAEPIGTAAMRLAGYRWTQQPSSTLTLFPYWYLSAPPGDVQVHLELRDAAGQVVASAIRRPFYNSTEASSWPTGSLADDAYELALPPNLPGGTYRLYIGLAESDRSPALQLLGSFDLAATPALRAQADPGYVVNQAFDDQLHVIGYEVDLTNQPVPPDTDRQAIVAHPGDIVAYTLYWRSLGLIDRDYLARVEMVNQNGIGVIGDEHIAGMPFNVTTGWDLYRLTSDRHKLTLTEDFEPGLYAVELRVLDPATRKPLPADTGDHVSLRPIKVVRDEVPAPQRPTNVEIATRPARRLPSI